MHDNTSSMGRGMRLLMAALAAALLWLGAVPGPAAADEGSARAAERTVQVDLNTATAAELEKLPGIGPSKAGAIVALRERLGRFRRVEQILRVRGIGRATFRKLRPMITVK